MPKLISDYRLIHEPLRLELARIDEFGDDGWPKYKHLFDYLRQQPDWHGSERDYRSLRVYGAGSARLVEGLFEYLLQYAPQRLRQFVPQDGGELTRDLLLERYTSLGTYKQARTDWRIADSWSGITSLVASTFFGSEEQMLIRDSSELTNISRWVMEDLGRAVAREPDCDVSGLNEMSVEQQRDAFFQLAEQRSSYTVESYAAVLREWWHASEWAVVNSVLGDSIVGASVMLPLRQNAYEGIKNCELADFDLHAEHLEHPSRYLLLEALTNSYDLAPKTRVGWATGRQIASVFLQAAHLSWSPDENRGPVHVLCIAGSVEAAQRLERHGYQKVGRYRFSDVPVYELVIPDPGGTPWLPRSPKQAISSIVAACYYHIERQG